MAKTPEEQQRLSKQKDPAKVSAYNTTYYLTNASEIKASKAIYRANNHEKCLARTADWRSRHQEDVLTYSANWAAEHPENRRAAEKSRRAKKSGAPKNDLTHVQWGEIQAAQDHCCAHCHKRCKGKLTQDHITALDNGGSHTLHNVIAVCRSCNSKKGVKTSPVLVQPLLLTIAPPKKKKAA